MPAQVLVRATDGAGLDKGEPVIVRDSGEVMTVPWGAQEGLPDFIVIEITDRAAHQIQPYMDQVTNAITWEVLNSNANGRRYRLKVNPNVDADFPTKSVGQDLRDYLEQNYQAVWQSWGGGEMVIDIPNTQWSDLRDDIIDKFEEVVKMRRYMFAESDVDFVVAQGGFYSTTFSTVGSRIVDRYPD